MNFWKELPKPIIGLSPLDGLTDASFRELVCTYGSSTHLNDSTGRTDEVDDKKADVMIEPSGKPSVVFTEFINYDKLMHKKNKVINEFLYHEIERPIVAQIFGNNPDDFYKSAQIVCELGFDGLDINMGCPSKNVTNQGSGAGLIRTPALAIELILAAKQGVRDWVEGKMADLPQRIEQKIINTKKILVSWGVKISSTKREIPVSVKTRIGYDASIIEKWLSELLKAKPACITVHGRTHKEMYKGRADWDAIARGKKVVDAIEKISEKPIYLGNGDIKNLHMAEQFTQEYNLDGVLVGRAVLSLPGFFQGQEKMSGLNEIKKAIISHSILKQKYFPDKYYEIRKHLMWYIKSFPDAADLRRKIALVNNHSELLNIISCI